MRGGETIKILNAFNNYSGVAEMKKALIYVGGAPPIAAPLCFAQDDKMIHSR